MLGLSRSRRGRMQKMIAPAQGVRSTRSGCRPGVLAVGPRHPPGDVRGIFGKAFTRNFFATVERLQAIASAQYKAKRLLALASTPTTPPLLRGARTR